MEIGDDLAVRQPNAGLLYFVFSFFRCVFLSFFRVLPCLLFYISFCFVCVLFSFLLSVIIIIILIMFPMLVRFVVVIGSSS